MQLMNNVLFVYINILYNCLFGVGLIVRCFDQQMTYGHIPVERLI